MKSIPSVTGATAKIVVGQRVHCGLYGGQEGVVIAIHGEQNPGSVRILGGGIMCAGGCADLDIAFENHISRRVPEAIVRGVQWRIYEDVANVEQIMDAIDQANAEAERKRLAGIAAEEQRAAERQTHIQNNPHLTQAAGSQMSGGKLAAVNIRKELKLAFPSIKFSVRSDYNSVDVSWTNGPTAKAVDAVIKKYQGGSFNGMEDIYENNADATFAQVFGDAKYVFSQRNTSAAHAVVADRLAILLKIEKKHDYDTVYQGEYLYSLVNKILGNTDLTGRDIAALKVIHRNDVQAGHMEDFYQVI